MHAARKQIIFPLVFLAAFLFGGITSGLGHDFWIAPSQYLLDAPDRIDLSLKEGVALKGDTLPYIPAWFQDFSQSHHQTRMSIYSDLGSDPAATIIPETGLTLIGYHSNRVSDVFKPEKFLTYLEEEALDDVIALREQRGESGKDAYESFVRCAKSLIQTGPVIETDLFATKLGYTLELIPKNNPYALAPGDTLTIELLYQDKPLANRRVRAFTSDQPDITIDVLTNAQGIAQLTLPHAGEWLIKSVHLVPFEDLPPVEWESYWASLTFEMRKS